MAHSCWIKYVRRPLPARGSAPWEGPAWENFIATFDIEDPPAQVRKRAFEFARPSVPAATFDIEDHPSTGQKTGFLSSPGHAVSLFWSPRFGKPWRSEVEVHVKAKSRCEIKTGQALLFLCRFKTMLSSGFCRKIAGKPLKHCQNPRFEAKTTILQATQTSFCLFHVLGC